VDAVCSVALSFRSGRFPPEVRLGLGRALTTHQQQRSSRNSRDSEELLHDLIASSAKVDTWLRPQGPRSRVPVPAERPSPVTSKARRTATIGSPDIGITAYRAGASRGLPRACPRRPAARRRDDPGQRAHHHSLRRTGSPPYLATSRSCPAPSTLMATGLVPSQCEGAYAKQFGRRSRVRSCHSRVGRRVP
jgi:hypothetical protein